MNEDLSFIGKNIRCLRRERGWTLIKLASKIGTSDVVLGRIERSVNAPSALLIHRLAKALNISVDALFAEKPETLRRLRFREEKTPFRVAPNGPVQLKPKIKRMAADIIEGFQALEDICDSPKHAQIPLIIPFEPDAAGMEQLALTVRRFMGVRHGIVFDHFELFENQGFRVIVAPLGSELNSFAFYDLPHQNAFFFINSRKNTERQLFSLAYELGAVIIAATTTQTRMPLFPSEESADKTPKPFTAHRAASRFAGTFLMPAPALQATVKQLGIRHKQWSYELLLRIKHRFGVSAESFLYRLNEIDLIDPSLVETLKHHIETHYAQTDYGEPGSSKRILTPNGRLGDLILTGKRVAQGKDEVLAIEKMLAKWRVRWQ